MAELAYAPPRSRFSRVQSSLDDSIAAAHDCYRSGDAEEAAAICRRILRQNPGHGEALKFLGAMAVEQGSTGQAIRFYQQALQTNSHDPVVHHGLATALRFAGRDAAAEDAFRQAITLAADWADPFTGLGNLLKSLGRFDEAIDAHRQALRRAPNSPEILSNLGTTLKDSGRHEEAIETLSRALALAPNAAEIHYNLGNAQLAAHRPAESAAVFTRALQLDPGHLRARVNLGISLKEQGQLAAAITCLRRATSVDPGCADARWNLSLALLLAGDLTEGWQHYEWRRKLPGFPVRHFDALDWDGYPLGGRTLLLHAEQGLGDSLQFIRYAAQIGGPGSRVIFQCPRSLVALLSGCPGLDAVVSDDEVPPDFDVQAPLLSVPGLCGTTLETVPAEVPYLRPPPDRVSYWSERLRADGELRIGICWQGNPSYEADYQRSIPLIQFAALGELKGMRLYALQKHHGRDQLDRLDGSFAVHDLGRELDSDGHAFLDTAAAIANLDLVITSDTAVAHLAGALAAEVWLLLPHAPDWRWGLTGDRTPWYPTMRLFRQPTPGDWRGVFDRVLTKLGERTP